MIISLIAHLQQTLPQGTQDVKAAMMNVITVQSAQKQSCPLCCRVKQPKQ